ncbi:hypothetical protein D9619_004239 [Psilocybe cf. subviscida]|uniref:F-box domain-containing protein n=1 Tax=Psilocybe cf. subviscida TaxID=2480587 RepID=A0A8H5F7R7_9AGAR|nr:hypothetical protein D9619_004239 [Psilocybe cf. subviscida]
MNKIALATSIIELERRRCELQEELDFTIRKLDKQRAQHAALVNKDTSPIYRLPNELLMSIFIMQQRDDRAGRYADRKRYYHVQVLARVSQHWRSTVFGTPLLWNVLDLRLRNIQPENQRFLKFLDAQLLHSGTCPLDITLEYLQTRNIGEYFSRLACHASRWRRLSILALDEFQETERLLRGAHTPMLKFLSVTSGPVPPTEDLAPAMRSHRRTVAITPSICISNTKLLGFVRIAGHALGCIYPPLVAVTVLHLDGWAQPVMTDHDIVHILRATPSLNHLSLNKLTLYHSRDPMEAPPALVTLPHLQSLRVRGPCSPLQRFFSIMDTPVLHSLAMYQIPDIKHVLLKTVRSLTLDGCPMDAQDIRELTHMLPAITQLDVDDDMPAIFRVLNPELGAPAWLHLHELRLNYLTSADVSDLSAFLLARQRCKETRSIDTVYLDRRSRLSLRQRNALDTICATAKVFQHDQVDDLWPADLPYDDVHDCFV